MFSLCAQALPASYCPTSYWGCNTGSDHPAKWEACSCEEHVLSSPPKRPRFSEPCLATGLREVDEWQQSGALTYSTEPYCGSTGTDEPGFVWEEEDVLDLESELESILQELCTPLTSPLSSEESTAATSPTSVPPPSPPSISPLRSPPTFIDPSSTSVQLSLLHKPRGSNGAYVPLDPEQHIRVTKGKGKRLRLVVASSGQFEWAELKLHLVDVPTNNNCHEDFHIWNHKSTIEDDDDQGTTRAEVEVTVNKISTKLHFEVSIASAKGWTWQGRTTPFTTHNNGKDRSVRLLKKRRRAAAAAAAAAAKGRHVRNKFNPRA